MGHVGHSLFGLATDDSVNECLQAIDATRTYQKIVVHQVNRLTTVLNCTQAAMTWNRQQLNKLMSFVSRVLIPGMNSISSK